MDALEFLFKADRLEAYPTPSACPRATPVSARNRAEDHRHSSGLFTRFALTGFCSM